MRIGAITHFRYALPLSEPMSLGGQIHEYREGILILVRSDRGEYGWGDAAPLPGFSRESLEKVIEQLNDLESHLVGRDVPEEQLGFFHLKNILPRGFHLVPSLRFGLELAFLNLRACTTTSNPAELFGLPVSSHISLCALLSGNNEKITEDTRRAIHAGFRAVKLKVGRRSIKEDIERVHIVRQIIGPDVYLRVDANQAWTIREAAHFFQATASCGLEFIEEPLANASGLERLVNDTGAPVALDETLVTLSDREFSRYRYARAIIIKPTFVGGMVRSISLAQLAIKQGLYPVLSASFESGVGIAGLIALASILNADRIPAGLDTYRWLSEDVLTSRLPVNTPVITVSDIVEAARSVDRKFTNFIS